MTHIAFVMPDPTMVKVVHEAWELHQKIFGKNRDLHYTVNCEIQPDVIVSRHYNADVIVSRGGTAAALKERNFLVPVVEIPVTSSDIAASIRNPVHVTDCAKAGADIATVPYKVLIQMISHPLTSAGIDRFLKDWESVPKKA